MSLIVCGLARQVKRYRHRELSVPSKVLGRPAAQLEKAPTKLAPALECPVVTDCPKHGLLGSRNSTRYYESVVKLRFDGIRNS